MVRPGRQQFWIENRKLRYPPRQEVSIDFKTNVKVEIGKFSLEFPMYVTEIENKCILRADFLVKIGQNRIFNSLFSNDDSEKEENISCSRISLPEKKVFEFLLDFFNRNSVELNDLQKESFSEFLEEFQDIFSENIIAGNCSVIEHSISVGKSSPIKQTPRRIPLQMRDEVEKIFEEMKQQEVIEESYNPWVHLRLW
ncbi:hypothetical protein P5V15_007138 [Pogonomyrmex californicus]